VLHCFAHPWQSDFNAIESFRGDSFFKRALNLIRIPSSATLRQRLDACASEWFEIIPKLKFAMDNGQTKKEAVGRTYAGVDGYCPFAAYLGHIGYCLELALRPGTQHSASETQYNLERFLPMAVKLVLGPLLLRADSGFCSLKLMQQITAFAALLKREIAFIIKWNPRKAPVEAIAAEKVADASTQWTTLREGKRECIWVEKLDLPDVGSETNPARRVYRLTERTIDKHGVVQLMPNYELEGWTTILPESFNPTDIIDLYCDHGTHEQFHSEFKTDMNLERLPSGKFDTNYLICQMAALAMNLLRLIGQNTLIGPDSPVRHTAERRRIKTVLQEIMYKAGRMIQTGRRWVLGLGENDRGYDAFERHYKELSTA